MARGVDPFEALSDVLSEHAQTVLRQRGMKRNPRKTCTAERLTELLAERGLPVWDTALELERRLGGVTTAPGMTMMGVFAALQGFESDCRLSIDRLLRYEDQILLPVSEPGNSESWMDRTGVLYMVFPDDDFCTPTDASYLTWLERSAFVAEDLRIPQVRPFGVMAWTLAGETAARALGVPLFSPASDQFGTIWYQHGICVDENRVPNYRCDTVVRADTIDAAVRALEAIAGHAPEAPLAWLGPRGEPPRAGEPVRRFARRDSSGSQLGEILVVGEPGRYRVVSS
ncbi:hypothetical protein WMF30_52700 [Sorangium sp. So ce134]